VNKEKLQKIFTKIGEINPDYTLDKQVYNAGKLIQFINNPTEKVQLAAVRKNTYSIRHIKNPTEKVQLVAIKQYPYSIQYIKNPSERTQ
jgi:hypothetical protein